jgi:regulator of RNase E activity RraA
MKITLVLLTAVALAAIPGQAQIFKLTRDQMIQYTARNPYDRFPDGRPKVPDDILERVKGLSSEEVLGIERRGYPSQYEANWKIVKPEKKLVGRAVTLLLMPIRPEVAEVDSTGILSSAPREKQISHQSALNLLQPGDVIVIDAHAISGGIIGDNLAYYIYKKGAGFVIDGQIRDLDGIGEIDMTGYYREAVPRQLHGGRHQCPGDHRQGNGHARGRGAGRQRRRLFHSAAVSQRDCGPSRPNSHPR